MQLLNNLSLAPGFTNTVCEILDNVYLIGQDFIGLNWLQFSCLDFGFFIRHLYVFPASYKCAPGSLKMQSTSSMKYFD